jgi:penicillin-binding protein 1B
LELSPLEVLSLYQTLANGGFASEPRSIREVLTADGQPLHRYPLEIRQVADPAAVYLTDYALQQVVAGGTGRSLQQKLPAEYRIAGKTGTTNDRRDSWFAGFSGNLVGVVWMGRDDNRPAGLTGASGALRIFGDALRGLSLEPLAMVPPGDIELISIDPVSGGRADERCSGAVVIPFVTGSGPVDPAPCSRGGSQGGNPLRWFLDRFLSE